MSLVLTWFSQDSIGIVCDGRSSRRDERGNLVPMREDYQKAWHLSERIVFASTGCGIVGRTLLVRAKAFADLRQDDGDLFQALVEFITADLPPIRAKASVFFEETGTAVMLLGFDALRRRMRHLSFISDQGELKVFEESEPRAFAAIGNVEATQMAAEICSSLNSPSVDLVLPLLQYVALSAADRVPWSVNKNLQFSLILPSDMPAPERKGAFPKLDEFSALYNSEFAVLADGATFKKVLHVDADNTFHVSTMLNSQGSIATAGAVSVFSYTSTTSSITWNWVAFTIYRLDGTTLNVSPGSATFSSLSAGTTYHFGIYVDIGATVHVVLSDRTTAVGSLGWQVQTIGADGHSTISVDATAATPTSGSGGGAGGGGGGTCPADDEPIETLELGFVPAMEVKAGMHVRGGDGSWREVEESHSVEGWLQYVLIDGDDWHHVDVDHRWLRPEGDFRADLNSERDWQIQNGIVQGDTVKGADEKLYRVLAVSPRHRGSYRKIQVRPDESGDRSIRMGRVITHNFFTLPGS